MIEMLNYLNYLLVFQYIDVLEILIFTFLFYYLSLWLKNDTQKNILISFFCYLIITIGSYFTGMYAICNFFISFSPALITVFFLIHQRTLQKNFITLKKITPAKNTEPINWFDEFMRSILTALGNNRQLTVIIENKNIIENFLSAPFFLNIKIQKELLDVLINSASFNSNKLIWISNTGILKAINVSWNINNSNLFLSNEIELLDDWKQQSIIFTTKFDAFIFRTYPEYRTFDVIASGNLIENLTSNNFLKLTKEFVNDQGAIKKEDYKNEVKLKNFSNQQPMA